MSKWIKWEWSEEKPFPETEDTIVHILMLGDDVNDIGHAMPVRVWIWTPNGEITHYMLEEITDER